MKKQIIAMVALSLFALTACSDDNTAGNAVEPNGIADLSSSSEEASSSSSGNLLIDTPSIRLPDEIDFEAINTFTTAPTERKKFGLVTVSTYKDENAASGSCTVGQQELSGIVKINDGLITRAYSGRNLKVKVPDIVYMLKKTCAYTLDAANQTIDSLNVQGDSFDFACISGSDDMSIDDALGRFKNIMTSSCTQLDMQASLDSLDSARTANAPVPIIFSDEDPNEKIILDTTSRTLASYALQYAKPEELSFDPHVMAYNSNLRKDCFTAMDRYKESNGIITINSEPIMPIEREAIPACYPATSSIVDFTSRDESCKYYLVGVNDGAQPTGHVLSKVARDTIETINISPSGTCAQTCEYFTVYFLIEDCEDIINENTIVSHRGAKSSRWRCEETNPDQSINVRSYGEWYSEKL